MKFNVSAKTAEISQKLRIDPLTKSQRDSAEKMSPIRENEKNVSDISRRRGGPSPRGPRQYARSMGKMIFSDFQKLFFWMKAYFGRKLSGGAGKRSKIFFKFLSGAGERTRVNGTGRFGTGRSKRMRQKG